MAPEITHGFSPGSQEGQILGHVRRHHRGPLTSISERWPGMDACRLAVGAAAPKSYTGVAPRGSPVTGTAVNSLEPASRAPSPNQALARPNHLPGRKPDGLILGPTGLHRCVRDGLRSPAPASRVGVPAPLRIASSQSELHERSAVLQMKQFVMRQPSGTGLIVPTFDAADPF